MAKAITQENGVTWADSKSGRLSIAVGPKSYGDPWEVWALYKGTHDLAPRTRSFKDEQSARAYANHLWAVG